jgi:hypothetical protein
MKQHKWANEIKAWANGATVEYKNGYYWLTVKQPNWNSDHVEFRIKPQHKEQQYVYAYKKSDDDVCWDIELIEPHDLTEGYQYIGKIKLEVD